MSKERAEDHEVPAAAGETIDNRAKRVVRFPGQGESRQAKRRRRDREHKNRASFGSTARQSKKGLLHFHARKIIGMFVTDREGNELCLANAKGAPGTCAEFSKNTHPNPAASPPPSQPFGLCKSGDRPVYKLSTSLGTGQHKNCQHSWGQTRIITLNSCPRPDSRGKKKNTVSMIASVAWANIGKIFVRSWLTRKKQGKGATAGK